MMKQWLLPLWLALVGLQPEEPLKVVGKTDLDQGARRTVEIAETMTAARALDLTREAIRKAPVILLEAHPALTEVLKDKVDRVAPRQDQELNQVPLPVAQMAKLLSQHRF